MERCVAEYTKQVSDCSPANAPLAHGGGWLSGPPPVAMVAVTGLQTIGPAPGNSLAAAQKLEEAFQQLGKTPEKLEGTS